MGEDEEKPVERRASQARQGEASGRIAIVLAVSLALLALAFGILIWAYASSPPAP